MCRCANVLVLGLSTILVQFHNMKNVHLPRKRARTHVCNIYLVDSFCECLERWRDHFIIHLVVSRAFGTKALDCATLCHDIVLHAYMMLVGWLAENSNFFVVAWVKAAKQFILEMVNINYGRKRIGHLNWRRFLPRLLQEICSTAFPHFLNSEAVLEAPEHMGI